MKKLNWILLAVSIIFSACEKLDELTPSSTNSIVIGCGDECNEWERCVNISQDFFGYEMACRPKLELYTSHGNWNGQLNIVDDLGNSFTEELLNLDPICANPTFYFNSETWKYIMLPYPLSESAFYSNNGIYPDTELNYLDLEFTDPISLEFIINDSIYDPFVESIVFYQGTGQIKNTNGSAHAILEFNCEYFFEDHTFSVSFSATR